MENAEVSTKAGMSCGAPTEAVGGGALYVLPQDIRNPDTPGITTVDVGRSADAGWSQQPQRDST
jgi:hypothetical protein